MHGKKKHQNTFCNRKNRVKWVPVTKTWPVLRLRMEKRPQIWRVAANILNKKSWTADTGSPPAWGLGDVLTTPHYQNVSCYDMVTKKA